jgi:DNA-binding LacI/PurR family transcriptional regulator
MGTIRLRDIAQRVGVSIRTVSRAIHNSGYVDPDRRQAILQAAKELGYQPDRAARSLRTGRSFEVVVLSQSMDEMRMAVVAAFERVFRGQGYTVSMVFGSVGIDRVEDLIREILQRRPAGVLVLVHTLRWFTPIASALEEAGVPAVAVDVDDTRVDRVCIDRQQGVYEAVRYLHGKGRRRIAYLGPSGSRNRLDGYERALAELGLEPHYLYAESWNDCVRLGREIRAANPVPDAVQAFSDEWAMRFLAALHEAGVRVPQDVALVGFDDRWMACLAWPALTTVAQPTSEAGEAAAAFLLDRLSATESAPERKVLWLPTRLVVRQSG